MSRTAEQLRSFTYGTLKHNINMLARIKSKTEELTNALSLCSRIFGTAKHIPVFNNVLVEKEDSSPNVSIVASNGDNYVSTFVEIDSLLSTSVQLSFCVNGKDLFKSVSLIDDENVDIIIDTDNCSVSVEHSHGKNKFPMVNSSEFIRLKTSGEPEVEAEIDNGELWSAIMLCKQFVDNGNLQKPALNCARLTFIDGKLEGFTATDSHSMVDYTSDTEGEKVSVLVRGDAMNSILDVCAKCETVIMDAYENFIVFQNPRMSFAVSRTAGKYPDTKNIVLACKESDKIFNVSRSEIISSLERLSLAEPDNWQVKLQCSNNSIVITSENINLSKSSKETVKCSSESELTIGANLIKLKTAVSVMSSDEISIRLSDFNRPIVIFNEKKPNLTVLVMPVIIN